MRRRLAEQMLQEAVAHFEVVAEYGEADLTDQKTVDAICMRLSAGVEALSGLEAVEREALFGEVWNQMWGMRNRIAHGYLLVEPAIVASTLERDVPLVIDIVKSAIDQLTAGTDPDRPRGPRAGP